MGASFKKGWYMEVEELMQELPTRETITLKHLIVEREALIKKLTARSVDETYFRRENLMKNHTQESETQLLSAQNDVKSIEKVVGIIEERIKNLMEKKK